MSNAKRSSGTALNRRPRGTWDASECALLLIDYQENVLDLVFEQDRRVVELNARTLATAARAFNIPVVLSTVGVQMGVNKPTIASLKAALPDVKDIDRSSMNAWEDAAFVAEKPAPWCDFRTMAPPELPFFSSMIDLAPDGKRFAVLVRLLRVDNFPGIHFVVGIPDPFELAKRLHEFSAEHDREQFGPRLAVAVFSG